MKARARARTNESDGQLVPLRGPGPCKHCPAFAGGSKRELSHRKMKGVGYEWSVDVQQVPGGV